jgi:hypothetical protein
MNTYTLYTDDVKLADGLTLNGTNYVSKDEVDVSGLPKVFKLTVKDSDGNTTEEFEHAKLLQQVQYAWDDNKWYLAFAPVSEQEIINAKMQSNLEYLAMMADVDIDE